MSNKSPAAALPGSQALAEHPARMGDPWQPLEQRLPGQGESIVVLGTGLTTVDVIISLRALGWVDSIHAISRHGWFPHPGVDYDSRNPHKTRKRNEDQPMCPTRTCRVGLVWHNLIIAILE